MWETIKQHKYLVLGGVGIIVVLYFYSASSGGGTSSASSDYSTEVQAATALQGAQLQAQSQAAQSTAALQANQDTIAGQIQLATIQAQTSTTNNAIASNVDLAQISATQQVQSLLGTLEAGVQTNGQNQATAQQAIQVNGQVQQSQILAGALTTAVTAQSQVAIANINAAQAVATSCHGLGCIF